MTTKHSQPKLAPLLVRLFVSSLVAIALRAPAQTASLASAGLRTSNYQGQFNAIQSDASGNLYLLLDQHDGIRILKTDPTATNVLAQIHLGAQGDIGLGLALDPTGNIYVTGTTSSGSLTATSGSAFPNLSTGSATNAFVAKFDSTLTPTFLTFTGSAKMAPTSIAATATGVFITGSIFATTLPVTPSAILQIPASGSFQNGFVEAFNSTGTTLTYATYLTGLNGDTAPAAIATDTSNNAYIAGYTNASGYPTLNALVPNIIPATTGATSGFLTKLTPAGDGLLFSTFIPGTGLTSIALDPTTSNILITGSISLGQFPVATVATPLMPTIYQTLLRLPLDGSAVLASTLLAPGTQSFVTPAPSSTAWVAGVLTTPLLPTTPLSTIGNTFAAHITAANIVDQTARFGGLPTSKPTFANALANLTSLTIDTTGQPIFAGSVAPTASSSLLTTETFDLPLFNATTTALPSTLRDAVPLPAACSGSLCAGSAAYLARLSNTTTPGLALSYDAAPNLTLRNLGSAPANALSITSTTFTLSTNCPTTLPSGSECSIALTSPGPGNITLQATNATTQIIAIPAFTASLTLITFTPKELDFGIQTASSSATTRTITITNLTAQPQTFLSQQDSSARSLPYTLAESASDCTLSAPNTKLLAPGATCHITLSLTASATATNDGAITAQWFLGPQDLLITGYTQAASLSLSASTLDFGSQYTGGLRLPRYLYLSNSSTATITHALVSSPPSTPFAVTDHCPTQLSPHSICQLQVDYLPTHTPSSDSATLALDQGLNILLTGQSLPQPGGNGASANPNLTVTPSSINFPNPVVVTTASTATQTVTIGNTGASPFNLSIVLTGDFTSTTNCAATLAANATCSVVFTFAPSQPGGRQGLLTVTAGAGTTPIYVDLTGTGTAILPANNGTLALGSVIVGQPSVQWFKVSQSFTTFAAASSSPDFAVLLVEDIGYDHGQPSSSAFTSNASGTCVNCWLGIQFTPSSTGPRTGNLTLTSSPSGSPYSLSLTGTGLPPTGLVLTPITQDFGTISIHSASASTLFTLTNLTTSTTPITLTAPTITGDFAVTSAPTGNAACAGTLAPAASCSVQITFTPTTAGQRTGTLTFTTSAGNATAQLTGFGSADPGLSLNPTSLTFTNIPGSTATLQTITLTNTGAISLQIATPTVTNPNFIPTTNCSTLAPAATCTITVLFTPSTAAITDTLQIPVTSTSTQTTYTVPLTGAYTLANAGLQITPTQTSFGPTPDSTLGLIRQFTINNLTAKSLSLDIALPRQFVLSGPPCSGLAPNASCTFSAIFLPLTNGDITGTLFAQANPTDGSPTLNALGYLEGYGLGSNTLAITGGPLSPGNILNFNQVASGQTSSKTLTLTNKGGGTAATLTIRRITAQWPFTSTSTCSTALTLNSTCTITVTYNAINQVPTGTTSPLPTNDSGVLTIESDSLTSPDLINLAGSATPLSTASPTNAAPILSYTASQNSLTFDSTPVGNASLPQTITLSNTGTATLHILSLHIDPDFTVASTCATLVPAASCSLTLTFTPQNQAQPTSTRLGALEILSDSSSSLDFISLVGSATPALLSLNPATLNFGSVMLGSSQQLPLQITNNATTVATFNSITATGDYTVSPGTCPSPGSALAPSSSCTLQVTFTPTATSTRTGSLSVSNSISNLPLTAALTGIGAQSHLQISPSSLSFGSITVGSPALLTFTLSNTGNAPVTNLYLSVPTSDFAITTPCPTLTLAVGDTCTITVTFTPSAIGARSANLTIASSDTSSPTLVPLTGTGLASGTFTLTVNGASSASATLISGHPATFNLTLTPLNNFSGSVALTCTPINAANFATCSLTPSNILLATGPQSAVATLQTVVSINQSRNTAPSHPNTRTNSIGSIVLCLLTPSLFLFWRRPRLTTLWSTLLTAAALATLLAANGCGGGGDSTLRYATPGNYQYQITASSTTGLQITQTVILNLTIQPR